jgi:uncharacterized damage-inducible protein DinB
MLEEEPMNEPMENMINELRQEAVVTKRVLERVPENKLAWKPHDKSMSLGQLAFHVAGIPGDLARLAGLKGFDASQANFNPPNPEALGDILAKHESSIAFAEEYLRGLDNTALSETWRLTLRGEEVFAMPRAAIIRSLMLNHWYHHRGQLSVYLRLLEVPVPVIYGRSADENPFS